MNLRSSFLASTLLTSIVLLCACRRGQPDYVDAIDVTSDLYHRARAGLFRVDREPLVLHVLSAAEPLEPPYFQLRSDMGALSVLGDQRGQLVVYMDAQMFFSHVQIACESDTARVFNEWPRHPID